MASTKSAIYSFPNVIGAMLFFSLLPLATPGMAQGRGEAAPPKSPSAVPPAAKSAVPAPLKNIYLHRFAGPQHVARADQIFAATNSNNLAGNAGMQRDVAAVEPCKAGEFVVIVDFAGWTDIPGQNGKQRSVRPVYRADQPGSFGTVTLIRTNPFSSARAMNQRSRIQIEAVDPVAKKQGIDPKRTAEVTSCY